MLQARNKVIAIVGNYDSDRVVAGVWTSEFVMVANRMIFPNCYIRALMLQYVKAFIFSTPMPHEQIYEKLDDPILLVWEELWWNFGDEALSEYNEKYSL